MPCSRARLRPFSILVVKGRAAIVEYSGLLEQLAPKCGQPASMNWLQHFLSSPVFGGKMPYLVLLVRRGAPAGAPRVDDVHAAVLAFEYRVLGLRTGAFSTDDWSGFRTVIAPEGDRAAVAAVAAEALLQHGAHLLVVSYDGGRPSADLMLSSRSRTRWASRSRPVAKTLLLEETYRATLAKMGKSTRFNLGYYRRRVQRATGCELVADVRGLLQPHELRELNEGSLNPIAQRTFDLQYESCCKLPGGFLLGLRGAAGQWLSLIGGWRQGGVTVLHWQMNTAGYERLSLGTAMRSFYVEHEVLRGTRELVFYGGTSHTMEHAFVAEEVVDLIVQRSSRQAAALRMLAWAFAAPRWFSAGNSLLAQATYSPSLEWQYRDAGATAAELQIQPM